MDNAAVNNKNEWDLIIKPKQRLLSFDLKALLHYRDLIYLFVKRDIQTVYKQTVLGPFWFVIQPIITSFIYIFVFGNLAKLSTDGVPRILFYFSGTMLWHYFQVSFVNVSDTFVANTNLFGKVYFPRLSVPLSKILSNMITLGIQSLLLAVFIVFYVITGSSIKPNMGLLIFPIIVLWLAALAMGCGLIVSAMTKKYRDLRQLISFGMQLWMYATPVVYPLSQIPGKLRWVMALNPVSGPLELFRSVAFGAPLPPAGILMSSAGLTILLFFSGLILFHKNETTFVDVA